MAQHFPKTVFVVVSNGFPFFSFAVRGQGVSENGIFVEKTSSPSVMIDLVLTDLFGASMDFKLQNLPDPTMARETVM